MTVTPRRPCCRSARERRRQEASLKRVRTLGEADEEVDDVAAWVSKNRTVTQQQQQQRRQEGADAPASAVKHHGKRRAGSPPAENDGDGDGASAAELAGLRVRHNADELEAGETVILTLADRSILDEKGALDEAGQDELEEVLKAQDKARRKAARAATKVAKPLWEEDGKRRSLLDKYDEEEAEEVSRDQPCDFQLPVAKVAQEVVQ